VTETNFANKKKVNSKETANQLANQNEIHCAESLNKKRTSKPKRNTTKKEQCQMKFEKIIRFLTIVETENKNGSMKMKQDDTQTLRKQKCEKKARIFDEKTNHKIDVHVSNMEMHF
jgi:hypothetical protein